MTLVINYEFPKRYYIKYDGGSYRKFLALLVVEEVQDLDKPHVVEAVDYFKEIDLEKQPDSRVGVEKLNESGIANMRQVVAQIFHGYRRLPRCQ